VVDGHKRKRGHFSVHKRKNKTLIEENREGIDRSGVLKEKTRWGVTKGDDSKAGVGEIKKRKGIKKHWKLVPPIWGEKSHL